MGSCVTQLPERKPSRRDSKPTTKRDPGTWGLYVVSSDEDDSSQSPSPHRNNSHFSIRKHLKHKKYKANKRRKRRNGCTQKTFIMKHDGTHVMKRGNYVITPREDPDYGEISAKQLQIEEELRKQHEHEEKLRIETEIKKEKERMEREKKERIQREKERKEREEKERIEREKKEKRARLRRNAMRELLSTEETYVNLLKECIDVFVDPLHLRPDLLVDKMSNINAHRILFSDIKIIYGVNSAFLSDLLQKIGDDNFDNETTQIGDDFARFTPYFRAYQSYLNNYDSASLLLSRITSEAQDRNKFIAFNEWYDGQRASYCSNKSLDFYLILPIQRLPRYKLCLTEIVKNTACDHRDLADLNIALQSISDVTMLCNDRMKEYESRAIVRDIEIQFVKYSAVDTCLVTPSRRFIKQGTLYRITRKGDSHKLTFYLFNDLLCYASELMTNKKLSRLQMRMQIDDIFHVKDDVTDVKKDKYDGTAFEIHSAVKSFIVYTENLDEKKQWLLALKNCMETIQKGVKYGGRTRYELSSALWIPDDWSENCMTAKCKKKFNPITNRRHHCRWCGKLICRDCGKYKLRHKIHCDNMIKPVCADCYETHHTRFRAKTCAKLYAGCSEYEIDDDEGAVYEERQPRRGRTSSAM